MNRVVFLLAALALVAAGCGESSTTEPLCQAGVMKQCDCDGVAGAGSQTCSVDGNAWGNCVCPQPICVAAATQPCDCDGKVGAGTQTCAADGKAWGECVCPEPEPDVVDVVEDVEPPEDIQPEDVEPEVELPLICLLNNCTENAHCTGCSDGRHICLVEENRCVACNPKTGEGCKADEQCSSWGICVPKTLTCPTDSTTGEPKVVCVANADCLACSPANQVCDTTTHKCVACTQTNTSHCLPSDICVEGKCSPKCPMACNVDNDCMYCGAPESPAHACNNHKCSECSPTWPCPAGLVCLPMGVCYPPCGLPGPVPGQCMTEKDCNFCGDPKTPGTYDCKKPLNDPDGHGTCVPPVEGCEDIGPGVAVLPAPWSDYTQLCSNDDNCKGVGIQLNIGKLVRDLIGADEVMGIAIGDANVTYEMAQCAEIKIMEGINCGVCVPCKEDKDCKGIPIDGMILQLFKEDPLAMIAGALLINMLWGSQQEHNLNFYCQPVAMGYGVCAPCANPLQKCAGGSSGGGSGKCEHEVCETGSAMDPSCSSCSKAVCEKDGYCCETEWDAVCVKEVDQYCATPCGGSTGCAPDICTNDNLLAQDPSCGGCVAAVCTADPFCCNKQSGAWDTYCVSGTKTQAACASLCGGGCAHDECTPGGPLVADCSACAKAICTADPYCCQYEWDSQCIDEAKADNACSCN